MTSFKFTDPSGDTLKVENLNAGGGYLSAVQGAMNAACFELRTHQRLPIAKAILEPLADVHLIEGKLPEVNTRTYRGKRVASIGGACYAATPESIKYVHELSRQYTALALALEGEWANESKRLEAEAEALRELKERKDKLAQEFSGITGVSYTALAQATQKAIDAVITLEDR